MIRIGRLGALVALAALAFLAAPALAEEKVEVGFKPLGNGKDMSDFTLVIGKNVVKKSDTWTVEDGVIKCKGKPNGYFATKKSYRNYVLRFDFRYPEKAGNSGFLINITGEHKTWPKCIEVQGQYNNVCMIFPISGAKGKRPPVATAARNKVRKPHTEWNSVEIVVKDGAITSMLNGTKVCESEPYDLKEGPIGFQSEGTPIEFRNLRIKEMK
jgi:hypothetical protein